MSNKSKILIIDDEPDMLSACAKIISILGNDPVPVADVKKAIRKLEEEEFDLIFSDLLMPEYDGMEVLEICQKLAPNTPVIIFSAYGTIDRAVAAMKAGAFDFIEKPFDANNLKILIEKGLRQRNLFRERVNLLKQLDEKYHFDNIIGKSLGMRNIFDMIENVSKSDANILITGESGTGKELIARSIHARSKRKIKAFVPVNCGAFPENLFEAELFGYEKGAFTGAVHRKVGLIEYADGGTFFS
jgi:DNA-binding NtrC family response regulator